MSSGTEAGVPEPDGLQFDHAEFEQAPPSSIICAACKRPIVENYFAIGGAIVCEPCRNAIESQLRGGSGLIRFLRAIAFGTGAAAVGTLAYAAFIRATNIDFGLVSILVGYLIGRAVRAGSRNRGGLPYQLLAVLLTYLAVGMTYTTILFLKANPMADPNMPEGALAAVFVFAFFSVRMPVWVARESVVMIAIIGFALWQAWKMTVRFRLPVSGPFRVGEPGPAGPIQGLPPMLEVRPAEAITCPDCGTQVASHFLICPGCHRLVHAEALKRLAGEAATAESAGDWTAALIAWRSALERLPPGSKQHGIVSDKVSELGKKADAGPAPRSTGGKPGWAGNAAGIGTIALMLAGKAKLLLLGLTKLSTLASMFVTVGAYWTLWGWPFAIGLVLTTYVHEMGHVAALLRYGIKADAPMFIPGIGAVIRARQRLSNPREEAQVGLGGPLWGLGSVAACYLAFLATGELMFAAIAKLAAVINLFNLIPVWQLDGGHAYRAFSRPQRWLLAAVASGVWATMPEAEGFEYYLVFALMICAVARAALGKPEGESDAFSAAEYAGLVVALAVALRIPAPLP